MKMGRLSYPSFIYDRVSSIRRALFLVRWDRKRSCVLRNYPRLLTCHVFFSRAKQFFSHLADSRVQQL